MSRWMKTTAFAAAAGVLALAATAPDAEAQRWRRGSVAAGVAAGVVGGAIVGSLAARPYGYGHYGPGYAYAEPYAYPSYGYARPYYEERQVYYPGTYRRYSTGLRSGVTRVSPHYDYE